MALFGLAEGLPLCSDKSALVVLSPCDALFVVAVYLVAVLEDEAMNGV